MFLIKKRYSILCLLSLIFAQVYPGDPRRREGYELFDGIFSDTTIITLLCVVTFLVLGFFGCYMWFNLRPQEKWVPRCCSHAVPGCLRACISCLEGCASCLEGSSDESHSGNNHEVNDGNTVENPAFQQGGAESQQPIIASAPLPPPYVYSPRTPSAPPVPRDTTIMISEPDTSDDREEELGYNSQETAPLLGAGRKRKPGTPIRKTPKRPNPRPRRQAAVRARVNLAEIYRRLDADDYIELEASGPVDDDCVQPIPSNRDIPVAAGIDYACPQPGTSTGATHNSQPILPPMRRRALCVSSSEESLSGVPQLELADEEVWSMEPDEITHGVDDPELPKGNANQQVARNILQPANQQRPNKQVKHKGKGKKSKPKGQVNEPEPAAADELPDIPEVPKRKAGRPQGKKNKTNIGRKSKGTANQKRYADENREQIREEDRERARQRRHELDPLSEEAVAARAADAARKSSRRRSDVHRQAENDARINFDYDCEELPTFRVACLEPQAAFFMGENPHGYFNEHDIGEMDQECEHGCGALRFEKEKSELCCGSKGQLKDFEIFPDPPQPLFDLIMCRDQSRQRQNQREAEGAAARSNQVAGSPQNRGDQMEEEEEDARPRVDEVGNAGQGEDPAEFARKVALSGEFHHRSRAYNTSLALASLEVTESTMPGFNPTYKIVGTMSHRVGEVMSTQGGDAVFMQLYFVGPGEFDARMAARHTSGRINPRILFDLQEMLHTSNRYVKELKHLVEMPGRETARIELLAKVHRPPGAHPGTYNAPTANEVAAILVEGQESLDKQNLVLFARRSPGHPDRIMRVPVTHMAYDPLFYVLLFPWGSPGYNRGFEPPAGGKRPSMGQFYRFHLHKRVARSNYLLHTGMLFQQWCTDIYARIMKGTMDWVRHNQKVLRAESYRVVLDAVRELGGRGVERVEQFGRKLILPATITGTPRWYKKEYHNAMTVVRSMGKPSYFLTLTANPNWKEITRELKKTGQKVKDRPDLVCRVFRQKQLELLDDVTKKMVLGKAIAHVGMIEFQKRGPGSSRRCIGDLDQDLECIVFQDSRTSISSCGWTRPMRRLHQR